jgi:hypothetical protein
MDVDEDDPGKKMSAAARRPGAFGASTVRRYHQFPIAGNVFEVDVRYTNLVPVGGGSYGLVCSADDSVTQRRVAIKKVTNAFADLTDAKRIMREIKLLGQLGDHENIIGLVDVMTMPPLTKKFSDIYIVCEVRWDPDALPVDGCAFLWDEFVQRQRRHTLDEMWRTCATLRTARHGTAQRARPNRTPDTHPRRTQRTRRAAYAKMPFIFSKSPTFPPPFFIKEQH